MTTGPSLDIVLVNYNAGAMLRRCLDSVAAARHPSFTLARVVVVDNASHDDSLAGLDALPLPVTILRNRENRGFGAACNQGAAGTTSDYVLFLNPDMRLHTEALAEPLRFLEDSAHQDVGIVGIQLRDPSGAIARSSARTPTAGLVAARLLGLDVLFPRWCPSLFLHEWDHASSRELEHVIGAFYLVRRTVFDRLRGFDERFFVYLEDLDFSVRARQAGWRIQFLASAQAEHVGGGTSATVKASRIAYSLHSRIQYGFKHFSPAAAVALAAGTLIVEPIPRLVRALARGRLDEAADTCLGFVRLWARVLTGARG